MPANDYVRTLTSYELEAVVDMDDLYGIDGSYLRGYQEDQLHIFTASGSIDTNDKDQFVYAAVGSDQAAIVRTAGGKDLVLVAEGNTYVNTGKNDDTIIVGGGNNLNSHYLDAGKGDDTYIISKWSNNVTISESGGNDTLILDDKISAEGLTFNQVGDNLEITDTDQSGSVITIEDYFANPFGGLGTFFKAFGIDINALLSAFGYENKNQIETIVVEGQTYDFDEYVQEHLL